MYISNMDDFENGSHFFFLRPSCGIFIFVFVITVMVCAGIIWSLTMTMDDIVTADVFIRPGSTISFVRLFTSGEILNKFYTNDDYVHQGDLLLQIDISSDTLELTNSKTLLEQLDKSLFVYRSLLETIRQNRNVASINNEEAYLHSELYLIEYHRFSDQIEGIFNRLEREKSLPSNMVTRQGLEEMERNLLQARLQFSAWQTNQTIDTMNNIESILQNRSSLERRISDLEQNIRNASLVAPISGIIKESRRLNVGDFAFTGEEIIAIIPSDVKNLRVELYIDPAYIARLKLGQRVTLSFPGLPPSKFGKLDGVIDLIPPDYTIGTDSRPIFIVEANLPEPWLMSVSGEKVSLQAGMGAIGRIITDRDTVMRMILKKLDFINNL